MLFLGNSNSVFWGGFGADAGESASAGDAGEGGGACECEEGVDVGEVVGGDPEASTKVDGREEMEASGE